MEELREAVKNLDIRNLVIHEKDRTGNNLPLLESVGDTIMSDIDSIDNPIAGPSGNVSGSGIRNDTTQLAGSDSMEADSTATFDSSNRVEGATAETPIEKKPTVLFMLGMAGSGKTTFTQRFASHIRAQSKTPYILNFDPACVDPPFPVNIDIRDTVNYQKVMQQYNLGPNGGIVTSLNLFTTIFDQVLDIVKLRAKSHEYILVDTPGQLECFLWSASGQIILHSFAAYFPTLVIYVTDLTLCKNPITFASNMMYGVTILYKSKLPMILALNKIDIDPSLGEIVKKWIVDFEALESALHTSEDYSATFASSLTLALEEFYNVIENVIVSATDGYGMKEFEESVVRGVAEYNSTYVGIYKEMKIEFGKTVKEKQDKDFARFRKDFHTTASSKLFSMQATSTLTHGIDLLPHDSDDEVTSDSDSQEENETDDEETIGDFRTRESTKRDIKRNPSGTNPGTSSTSTGANFQF